jgi:hypothetical protein
MSDLMRGIQRHSTVSNDRQQAELKRNASRRRNGQYFISARNAGLRVYALDSLYAGTACNTAIKPTCVLTKPPSTLDNHRPKDPAAIHNTIHLMHERQLLLRQRLQFLRHVFHLKIGHAKQYFHAPTHLQETPTPKIYIYVMSLTSPMQYPS